MEPTYVDRILATFAEHGDREALVLGDRRISYAEAHATVHRLAGELRARGVHKGETVALCTGNLIEAPLIQLAAHLAGCWLVFVPPEPSVAEQRAYVQRCGAAAFIYSAGDAERGADLAGTAQARIALTVEDLFAHAASRPVDFPDRAGKADIATLFYTGGTTGRPKMVLHRHNYYDAVTLASTRRKAETPLPQRFLVPVLVNHASGHISTMMTLLAEGTVILTDEYDTGQLISAMTNERITSVVLMPPMLSAMLDHPSLPAAGFPDLVRLHYGGAPTTPARIEQALARFGPVLRQTYGLTEIPVITIMDPKDHDPSVPGRLSACGKPLPGLEEHAQISLRDPGSGEEVAPGGVGEVCIRGPLVMSEYWNDPELTAQAMADGWLHTGDLGRFDADGFLHLVDRTRDLIVTGITSANVYSNMLEDILTKQPGIRAAAVVGLPDDTYGESVHAVCVADDPSTVDIDELRKRAVEELGELYEPRTVTFVESLPWTSLGKIDKVALRQRLTGGATARGW